MKPQRGVGLINITMMPSVLLPKLRPRWGLPLAAGLLTVLAPSIVRGDAPPSDTAQIVHVLNRITFGPRPGDIEMVRKMGVNAFIQQQLHPETIDDSAAEKEVGQLAMLQMSAEELASLYQDEKAAKKERKKEEKAFIAEHPDLAAKAEAEAAGSGKKKAAAHILLAEADKEKAAGAGTNAAPNPAAPDAADADAEAASGKKHHKRDLAAAGMDDKKNADEWKSDAAIEQLEQGKLVRAVDSQRQLQEVLADFWNNHFNIDVKKKTCRVYKIADDRDVIRAHLWGSFHDLLEASAKSPAMLYYLDNASSTVARNAPVQDEASVTDSGTATMMAQAGTASPAKTKKKKEGGINENYAREVMELHTLGVDGGYTQKDVEEVARCFTGWTIDRQTGEFEFRPKAHDEGPKVVLGHQIPAGGGIQDGETVLDILAASPATAHHISLELCQRFVSDSPSDSLVNRIAGVFTQTGGNLRQVTEAILTSPEFLSPDNFGTKVKSPFEFTVSAVRATASTLVPVEAREKKFAASEGHAIRGKEKTADKMSNKDTQSLNWRIYEMGEPLFACTAPTGYKETSGVWVSPGALIERLNFALALTQQRLSDVRFDAKNILGPVDIDQPEAVLKQCIAALVPNDLTPGTRKVLEASVLHHAGDGGTVYAAKLIALIIGSPEFQRK